jgi:hypothetical protein
MAENVQYNIAVKPTKKTVKKKRIDQVGRVFVKVSGSLSLNFRPNIFMSGGLVLFLTG